MIFIVRSLVLVMLRNSIHMTARHIPGVHNVLNDAISRYQVSEDMLLRYGMKKSPVTIPQQLPLPPPPKKKHLQFELNKLLKASIQQTTSETYNHHWKRFNTHTNFKSAQYEPICQLFLLYIKCKGIKTMQD